MLNKLIVVSLVTTASLVTTCRQSDFTGSNDGGSKNGGSNDLNQPMKGSDGLPLPTPGPGIDGSPGPIPTIMPEGGTPAVPGNPPGVQPPGGCLSTNGGTAMDFESSPVGAFDGNTFWASRGVRFVTSMRVIATTRLGQAQPAKEDQAWLCIRCVDKPSRNRLVDTASETQVGQHVLASADPKNETQSLDIAFAAPVASGSFDLVDDDGSEAWTVVLFNPASQAVETRPLSTLKGYRPSTTGNGRPMSLTFSRPVADVAAIRLTGHKSGGFFGFAFDNFKVEACPPIAK